MMVLLDRKSRTASAQSFTLWQQATIEITRCNHSIIACLHHLYIGVYSESHIQRNANQQVAILPLKYAMQNSSFSV